MDGKLNETALGYAGGIISGAGMLALGILANLGIYTNAAGLMMQGHMFFSLTPLGILGGIIEAAVIGFVLGYIIAVVYNKFA